MLSHLDPGSTHVEVLDRPRSADLHLADSGDNLARVRRAIHKTVHRRRHAPTSRQASGSGAGRSSFSPFAGACFARVRAPTSGVADVVPASDDTRERSQGKRCPTQCRSPRRRCSVAAACVKTTVITAVTLAVLVAMVPAAGGVSSGSVSQSKVMIDSSAAGATFATVTVSFTATDGIARVNQSGSTYPGFITLPGPTGWCSRG